MLIEKLKKRYAPTAVDVLRLVQKSGRDVNNQQKLSTTVGYFVFMQTAVRPVGITSSVNAMLNGQKPSELRLDVLNSGTETRRRNYSAGARFRGCAFSK
jgi:hypothetical protein